MTGTISTTTSASRAAPAASSVARRRPSACTRATISASPGSSPTCERPALIASTTAGLTSTAMTLQPCVANWAASGRPILPAPTTATVPAVPSSPVHGETLRAGAWVHGLGGTVIDPPSIEAPTDGRVTMRLMRASPPP